MVVNGRVSVGSLEQGRGRKGRGCERSGGF